jgi:hypothetical protein
MRKPYSTHAFIGVPSPRYQEGSQFCTNPFSGRLPLTYPKYSPVFPLQPPIVHGTIKLPFTGWCARVAETDREDYPATHMQSAGMLIAELGTREEWEYSKVATPKED